MRLSSEGCSFLNSSTISKVAMSHLILAFTRERYDRAEKFARYQCCPTLEVYILVSQDEKHVEVYRQATGWQQERFAAGQTIKLEQLDLELPLESIYEGVL
jgi:Uma2 family endonuclease